MNELNDPLSPSISPLENILDEFEEGLIPDNDQAKPLKMNPATALFSQKFYVTNIYT